MMRKLRHKLDIKSADFAHYPKEIARVQAAAAPRDGVQMKPFTLYCQAMAVDTGCNVDLEPCCPRGPRHR